MVIFRHPSKAALLLVLLLTGALHAQAARVLQAERYERLYQAQQQAYSADAALALGDNWRDIGDPQRALPFWVTSTRQRPDAMLAVQAAELLIAQEDYAAALDLLQAAYPASPDNIPLNAMIGFLLAPSDPTQALPYLRVVGFDDRYDDAVLPLTGLINSPRQPAYSAQAGSVLAADGRYALAEAAYRYAVAWNPPYPEALAQVGYMRVLQGREGLSWVEQAVALAGNSADIRLSQALTLRALQQPDAALTALALARLYSPDNPVLLAETARTYDQMGLTDDARDWQAQADALATPAP